MRNAILVSFVTVFAILGLFLSEEIVFSFVDISDILYDFLLLNFDILAIVFVVLLVGLCVWFGIYVFMHRKKEELIEVVELKCPDDMTPVEVGFLVDGVVDSEDISSLLVYWASEKVIEISGDSKNQTLKKLTDLPKDAKAYEKKLFADIFKGTNQVTLSQVKERAVSAAQNTIQSVEKTSGAKFFDKKVIYWRQVFMCMFAFLFAFSMLYFWFEHYPPFEPESTVVYYCTIVMVVILLLVSDWHLKYYDYRHKNKKSSGRVWSFVLMCVAFVVAGAGVMVAFFVNPDFKAVDIPLILILLVELVAMFLAVVFSKKMQIYTPEGWKKLGQMLGFRQFLLVTEADRIKMMVDEQPDLFYEVLPYAYVLGVSDKWIKDFNVISANMPNEKLNTQLVQIAATAVVWNAVFVGMRGFRVPHGRIGGSVGRALGGGPRGGIGGGGPRGFGGGGIRRR